MAQVTRAGIKSTAIQSPTDDAKNHTTVLRQLKECIEIAQRLRGDLGDSYVRVRELQDAGIIRLVSGVVQPPNTNSPPGAAVPATRTVAGQQSISGGGDLTADRTFNLVNDSSTPGNSKYYGTDGSGSRGYFALPAAGFASPLTTKGDVHGFSTVDARVPVGADGTVLTADSTQTLGVKWVTPSGGGSSSYSGVRLRKTTATAVSSTGPIGAAMPWDTEDYDTNSYHSLVTNTSRVTIPTTGYYHMTGVINFSASSFNSVTLVKNGTTNLTGIYPGGSTGQPRMLISTTYFFTAGDYVELYAFASGAGNTQNTDGPCFFCVDFLGT